MTINFNAIERATDEEKHQLAMLAIGRLFRIGSRPYQDGDMEQYEECRAVVMACGSPAGYRPDYEVNYARDHNKGAQGA